MWDSEGFFCSPVPEAGLTTGLKWLDLLSSNVQDHQNAPLPIAAIEENVSEFPTPSPTFASALSLISRGCYKYFFEWGTLLGTIMRAFALTGLAFLNSWSWLVALSLAAILVRLKMSYTGKKSVTRGEMCLRSLLKFHLLLVSKVKLELNSVSFLSN